jgi:hypothetical protein
MGPHHSTEGEPLPNKTFTRALVGAALAVTAFAAPATADAALIETAPCDGAELTQPFAAWGDDALYKLAPGGDAEGTLAGWTFAGGGKVVSGSEPFAATGELGSRSFSLPAGGSVTSAPTCVNAGNPSFRFFVRSSGGLLGLLPAMKVDLVYRDGLLGLVALPIGTVLPSSSWKASGKMFSLSVVGAAVAGGEVPLSLRFTSLAGTWQVDDVFVDPFRRS